MNMKTLTCNEHGGTFEVERKRGRPPSHCSEANPCSMVRVRKGPRTAAQKKENPSDARQTRLASRVAKRQPDRTEPAKPATNSTPEASDVIVRHNPSVVMAKKAKDQLEPLGWTAHGRAWIDDDVAMAEVTATRGEETLALRWADGKFVSQDYSLWDADKTPGQQGMPKTNLPFDPYEMSDEELAKELAGRQVTWWNRIACSTEKAIIGDKFQIQHNYTGGNETSRQVLFVNKQPGHYQFRAFNVDALMRVK